MSADLPGGGHLADPPEVPDARTLDTAPDTPAADEGTCDWGYCERPAFTWRYDEKFGWLPVCHLHQEGGARGSKARNSA